MLGQLRALIAGLGLLGLVACTGIAPPAQPTPIAAATPDYQGPVPTPVISSGAFEGVFDAYFALRQHYNRPLAAEPLLEDAWEGAWAEARTVATVPAGVAPLWGGDTADDERALESGLRRLAELTAGRLDANELVFAAIEAMTDGLADNHTYFLRPGAWRRYQTGETVGFGYSTVRRPDGLLIWSLLGGGAAADAGLKPGDVVQTFNGLTSDDLRDRRASFQAGEPVTLQVDRPVTGVFTVTTAPRQFVRPVLDSQLIDGIAYVRLHRFPGPGQMPPGQTFTGLLDSTLSSLRNQRPRAWVLDLRNNPGGSEAAAGVVAGRFGFQGTIIENQGRTSTSKVVAAGEDALDGLPLVVLTNENSSSSAEIIAASLQDAGLAFVIGGKTGGVVNTSRAYEAAGGGVFVTTERILTGPDRRYLDGLGVFPDEAVSLNRERLAAGQDTQLERALSYLRSRVVAETRAP